MTTPAKPTIRLLGERVCVRLYEMPETTPGGLILPDSYRKMYDGKLFEIVAVSEKVAQRLCITADMGDRVAVGLAGEFEALPLLLEPDDIVKVRGARPVYSPEMSAFYGYDCWFLDVVANVQGRDRSIIVECWPKSRWANEEEAA